MLQVEGAVAEAFDVVVIGGGNAALCAALAASEVGARALVLERAPEAESGGNSRYTSGSMRFAFDTIDDLKNVMRDVSREELEKHDFGSYTADEFFDDMFRVTAYRTNPELCERLVRNSYPTIKWLADKGIRFFPRFTHAFKVGDRLKFSGSSVCEAWGGGAGLIEREAQIAVDSGVAIRYDARAIELLEHDGAVTGVRVRSAGIVTDVSAGAVVLACGGFEANAEWRARYLGPGWDLVKVRGTRFNTGDGLRMALEMGAMPYGHWSGCHAVSGDANAPDPGDVTIGDVFQRHSYPLGLMINADGRRFVDEGADIRHYTYAKYGRALMTQPNQFAWQVFDAKVVPLLRDEYRLRRATKVTAQTIEELAAKLEGVNAEGFLAEIKRYNAAVKADVPFNPAVKDGRGTEGLDLPKSNWANTLDQSPFEAYQISCGITFTFGGIRIDPQTAQVVDVAVAPIPGLYAAGEIVGGIFYFNYPGGTGLTSGSVFGRIAGAAAARAALGRAAP
jgi:tricarballylate dehydrogenase